MIPLRRYVVDDNWEPMWICELSEGEAAMVSGKTHEELKEGQYLDLPNPAALLREAVDMRNKAAALAARVRRSADLAAMLNRELEAARLGVSMGLPPANIDAIRGLAKSLLTGE